MNQIPYVSHRPLNLPVLTCSELTATPAADFVAQPPGFLPKVTDAAIRQWALDVHALWNELHREVSRFR